MPTRRLKTECLTTQIQDNSDINMQSLSCVLSSYLTEYIGLHKDYLPYGKLYDLVIMEVEKSLLQVALHTCEGNQKKASEFLGINRNTLRKKSQEYDLVRNQ